MKHDSTVKGKRRPVNMSIDSGVIAAARDVGINISQVSEAALRAATKAEQDRRWKEENRAAFDYWNDWVEENGLPLEKYRLF
ncbi:type II toxin-antitoxin system CcdA family antitoxin [Sphingomonas sp.]|uniref:type II toxin-antitoxin system CcdA family antitoxin n=1 Tax=Sphingomonas sp. TaxID=28214 RepID=UPI002DD62AF1|nr:type II toxin-antitoxin system CcdA family antitoxin [Sphingomonas sp.]